MSDRKLPPVAKELIAAKKRIEDPARWWPGECEDARGREGLIGVYHHASKKHLARYVDEFAFRLNQGNVAHHTLDRLESFIGCAAGKRLTYKGLTQ